MSLAAFAASSVAPAAMPRDDGTGRTIPYDYSFQFALSGRGAIERKTLTVSVEASFTAVAIGYGVVPEVSPIVFGPPIAAAGAGFSPSPPILASKPVRFRDITLGDLMTTLGTTLAGAPDTPGDMSGLESALRNGFKLNPAFAALALRADGNAPIDAASLSSIFQVVSAPPEGVQFLYALFDEGTGREFQSGPILNIAGLGAPDGKRPFRYFAKPITFAPLSTIRMEVTQISDFRGALHVALHGYRMLRAPGSAQPARERPPRRRVR